ncbi:MAG TPA: FTR1 family protein [Gemmatimonadaceae bacterium]|jgi:high-affinity iron transporter|nr:FTR1 family protein [Gemmatimonadaceae bacterium]
MNLGIKLGRAVAVLAWAVWAPTLAAQQDRPVQRIATIVSVAVEEYGKGVDEKGRLISNDEYQEAVGFLGDARSVAQRLPGNADASRALLDSIVAAVQAKRAPSVLDGLNRRFAASLGREAQIDLPSRAIDLAQGEQLFKQNCASCHGATAMGDGPAARAVNPRPTALADEQVMRDVTPAMMFRKISVGVTGTVMPAFGSALTSDQRWSIVTYLTTLRHPSALVAEGEGLYAQGCVSCHGMTGLDDGSVARALSKLPPELGSFQWQAERSDSQIAQAVLNGIPGSPMPPSRSMTPRQVEAVVAYLRALPTRERTVAATARSNDTGAAAAGAASLSLLEQALNSARIGQLSEAGDRAFDAYLAFEPIETPARARDPGVVAAMERLFADFKGAIRANDLHGAQRAYDALDANMPRVIELTQPPGSGREAFLQSFLIILREGFEAILVIGAVVAFLLKTGHRERLRSIWLGIVLALVASGATAVVLRTVLSAIPATKEIIEGATLLAAVGVLFSVSYWLISRVEAAKWQQFIREKVNNALDHGGGRALAFVAFLAVYREGAETALFYQALFNEGAHVALPISLGIVLGFAALAVIFTLFYRYGVKIPLRPFFTVTSVLLYYMAFVFMGKGVRELQEGNVVPISIIRGLPTIEALGLYPTWQTVLAQLVLLALFVFMVAKTFWPKRSVRLPTVQPEPLSSVFATELDRLRAENDALKARLTAIETMLADPARSER